jgi:TPR repeat protein
MLAPLVYSVAALTGMLFVPMALAEGHLPPGVQVIYFRTPAYLDKPAGNVVYTKQDIEQAMELAKLGDAEAQANLGAMLQKQGNYKAAASWYKQAADAGIPTAAFNLGTLYYNGQGFPQDYTMARHWFELSAQRNDPYAQFYLGMIYGDGKGVDADAAKEMAWYSRAAHQGLAAAQFNLAVMYHNGESGAQDDVQAYAWMLLAQRGGMDTSEVLPVIKSGLSEEEVQKAEELSRNLYVVLDESYKEP